MVIVSKSYQITIPVEVRKDLNINQADEVVFVQNKKKEWILMTIEELTNKMVSSAGDINKTIVESKKGFKKGIDKSLKSLNNE